MNPLYCHEAEWLRSLRVVLAIVHAVAGAPTDYASVRAEVVKAYAQQAEEMARALEVLQETSASTSAAAEQIQNACTA